MYQFYKIENGVGSPLDDKPVTSGVFKRNTTLTLKVSGSSISAKQQRFNGWPDTCDGRNDCSQCCKWCGCFGDRGGQYLRGDDDFLPLRLIRRGSDTRAKVWRAYGAAKKVATTADGTCSN